MNTSNTDYTALLYEIQNLNTPALTTLVSDKPRFIIDTSTRKIEIPSEVSFLSVQHNHNAEAIFFEIDRYFEDEDLSKHTCIIQFENADSTSQNEGIYVVNRLDVESIEDKIIFKWEIEESATQIVGSISFSVRFYSIDNKGCFSYSFNTLKATSQILDSLDVMNNQNENINPAVLDKCVAQISDFGKQVTEFNEQVTDFDKRVPVVIYASNFNADNYTDVSNTIVDKTFEEISDLRRDNRILCLRYGDYDLSVYHIPYVGLMGDKGHSFQGIYGNYMITAYISRENKFSMFIEPIAQTVEKALDDKIAGTIEELIENIGHHCVVESGEDGASLVRWQSSPEIERIPPGSNLFIKLSDGNIRESYHLCSTSQTIFIRNKQFMLYHDHTMYRGQVLPKELQIVGNCDMYVILPQDYSKNADN